MQRVRKQDSVWHQEPDASWLCQRKLARIITGDRRSRSRWSRSASERSAQSAGSLENGILRQRSTLFLVRNVESVLIEFPILVRLFNYGTVTVPGFGGSRDSIKRVPKPERVWELIEEQH